MADLTRVAAVLAATHQHRHLRLLALVAVVALLLCAVAIALASRKARRRARTHSDHRTSRRAAVVASAPSCAVTAERLAKAYRMGEVTVRALRDVSVQIPAGVMVCIMGRSGSGKSTLLRQLGLLDHPSDGRIYLHGREVTGLSERARSELWLRELGYVFQEYALLPELSAQENVYLPAMMSGRPASEYRRRSAELLKLVGLEGRTSHLPKELSGGEQQRVAIARALVNDPRIISADEPTANLDSASAHTVMQTLARLNQTLGVTVVFVSHDPGDARYATQLLSLEDGQITEPNLNPAAEIGQGTIACSQTTLGAS